MLLTLVVFVLILGLLVFVHELGHFVAARKNGVKVEEFGFGFPPRIFGIKKGETTYSLNWIPLGGFVKIKGEDGENKEDEDSFSHKKIWRRAVILAAGVLMNFILAAVLLSIGFMIGLPQVINGENGNARIRDAKVQVVQILEGTPAAEAGLLPGDAVLEVDGQKIENVEAIQEYLSGKIDAPVKFVLERDGQKIDKEISPVFLIETGRGGIGVGLLKSGIVSYPWYLALWKGAESAVLFTGEVARAFYELIKNLIVTQKVSVDLSGPVGIAVLTGQVARMGIIYLLQFTALLSVNLAVINFLPFPALDGGRILFLIIEKIRRKPVSQKIENLVHNIGFGLLMLLVLLVTYRDVIKFSDKFVGLWDRIIK
ncbi:RIP metalloprotease RseP [Candidatus Falkowbacteria bacterium]|nr:RIP metalloprotease RseP [Candidatus Falkowbacteria bacterium]